MFTEIVGAAAVAKALADELPGCELVHTGDPASPGVTDEVFGAWLRDTARAEPFARFETTRSCYSLGRCALDADVASFGYAGVFSLSSVSVH